MQGLPTPTPAGQPPSDAFVRPLGPSDQSRPLRDIRAWAATQPGGFQGVLEREQKYPLLKLNPAGEAPGQPRVRRIASPWALWQAAP